METYYMIKTKCFIIRLGTGTALILAAGSIAAGIITEMLRTYSAASRMAYILGLAICAFMAVLGVLLVFQAFHFERFAFGGKKQDLGQLRRDLEEEGTVTCSDLVVTDHFVLSFVKKLFGMSMVIRCQDIIACFEEPVYGMVEKPSEYTLSIYDQQFKHYQIVLAAGQMEKGHAAYEKLRTDMPWIISADKEEFLDRRMTKSGRRFILHQIEKGMYQAQSGVDVDRQAHEELEEIEKETKRTLDFKSLLPGHGKKS